MDILKYIRARERQLKAEAKAWKKEAQYWKHRYLSEQGGPVLFEILRVADKYRKKAEEAKSQKAEQPKADTEQPSDKPRTEMILRTVQDINVKLDETKNLDTAINASKLLDKLLEEVRGNGELDPDGTLEETIAKTRKRAKSIAMELN